MPAPSRKALKADNLDPRSRHRGGRLLVQAQPPARVQTVRVLLPSDRRHAVLAGSTTGPILERDQGGCAHRASRGRRRRVEPAPTGEPTLTVRAEPPDVGGRRRPHEAFRSMGGRQVVHRLTPSPSRRESRANRNAARGQGGASTPRIRAGDVTCAFRLVCQPRGLALVRQGLSRSPRAAAARKARRSSRFEASFHGIFTRPWLFEKQRPRGGGRPRRPHPPREFSAPRSARAMPPTASRAHVGARARKAVMKG